MRKIELHVLAVLVHVDEQYEHSIKSAGAGRSVAAAAPDTCCLLLFLDFLSQMCQGMESIGVSLL